MIKLLPFILKHLGYRWVFYRVWYALQRKFGWLRCRNRARSWDGVDVPAWDFPVRVCKPEPEAIAASVVAEAERICNGWFRLFSHHEKELGFPPEWHSNAYSGEHAPLDRHWSDLPDFGFGDIKNIWELSRFPWAFTLARAYVKSGKENFVEAFWVLFEDWMDKNPPNCGVNWKCGQEAAFRMMAVVFAIRVFWESPATTPRMLEKARRFLWFTGERIEGNLGYALSQKNNHGVSECAGLVTLGLIFPGTNVGHRWLKKGLDHLKKQLDELVYPDGAFSQHSLIYHRVLLHDLYWCIACLNMHQIDVPDWLMDKTRRALKFLIALTDEKNGAAPLYGANDGACVLPIGGDDFLDMRPTIVAGCALTGQVLPAGIDGGAGELASWLSEAPAKADGVQDRAPAGLHLFRFGGCAILRKDPWRVFARTPERFIHRPGHMDFMHMDLWFKGRAITRDPGSFSYNSPKNRGSKLKQAGVHNVVHHPSQGPARQVSRFLTIPWPVVQVVSEEPLTLRTHAYGKLGFIWQRRIEVTASGVCVEDHISYQQSPFPLRLHWLLAATDWTLDSGETTGNLAFSANELALICTTDAKVHEVALVSGPKVDIIHGCWSPYYNSLEPACSLMIDFLGASETSITSYFHSK
ncbi:MAG: hypothetical protein GVY36_10770 [Verrucomicrobia bacterium]|jgi:hypothetical protein|nr:hypothetical protein [Verrucomicrobiota bacterium]